MAAHPLQDFIRRLRHARSVAEDGHLSDVQLLERFAKQRDEAAFEVLVWRHGALVLHVARRLLRRGADVEDVFQATFLTLARKAASIRRGTAVSSWLYKVAYRIALRVRHVLAQRERREQSGSEQAAAIVPPDGVDAETAAVLADEVGRLPERYRAAVVLCYLQGATTEEAARVLGCPRGTVLSRLASARQRLRSRLIRRGLAPAVALAGASFGEVASAMPPIALVTSVVKAALPFAAGGVAVSTVSPQAAALARGALQAMMWNKIKIAVVMVCVLGLVGTGAGWLTRGQAGGEVTSAAAKPPLNKDAPRAATIDAEEKIKEEISKIHKQLDMLAEAEEQEENRLAEELVEARLRVFECESQLASKGQELNDEYKDKYDRIRNYSDDIAQLQATIQDLSTKIKNAGESPPVKARKEKMEKLEREREKEKSSVKASDRNRLEIIRPYQKRLFQAEEALRRIETKQVRQREIAAAKRDALLARLQQLEGKSLHLDPNNHLRDMERKLDALRRELGELRRTLERPKDESRKEK
ncbi:MAG TPA: sigma-70 family RNA polymerase sigma factor [Gemmataceae bacterium]|jgi:RNA polymerase sigma factor (sigma-70 family)